MRRTNVIPDLPCGTILLKIQVLGRLPYKTAVYRGQYEGKSTKFKTSEGPIWWLNEFAKTNVGRKYRT